MREVYKRSTDHWEKLKGDHSRAGDFKQVLLSLKLCWGELKTKTTQTKSPNQTKRTYKKTTHKTA